MLVVAGAPSDDIVRVELRPAIPNRAALRLTSIHRAARVAGRPFSTTALCRFLLCLQMVMNGYDLWREHGQQRQRRAEEHAQGPDQVLLLITTLSVASGVINRNQDGAQDNNVQVLQEMKVIEVYRK